MSRPMKILVVSSDSRARDWVRFSVGSDAAYLDATNGLEALRIATAETPDVVVADETTEPYGAFGLARELKMSAKPPRVIVLLERTQDSWLARWSGADQWFVRPVDPFELAEAVRELAIPRPVASPDKGGVR
jgi:DNA-binding response OmpR family regulator